MPTHKATADQVVDNRVEMFCMRGAFAFLSASKLSNETSTPEMSDGSPNMGAKLKAQSWTVKVAAGDGPQVALLNLWFMDATSGKKSARVEHAIVTYFTCDNSPKMIVDIGVIVPKKFDIGDVGLEKEGAPVDIEYEFSVHNVAIVSIM